MSAKTTDDAPAKKITRDDIEAKFREIQGEVNERVEPAKMPVAAIAVGVAMATIVAAYWLGRRKGRRRQLYLEVRRI